MGLFGNKKKGQSVENESDTLTLENTEITHVDNTEGFSIVVEGVTTTLDGEGCIISGVLSGKVVKGQDIYIYQPGTTPIASKIMALEAKVEDRTTIVDEAENTTVSIQLDLDQDSKVRKYAVITNLGPQEKAAARISVENAALAGLIKGMKLYGKDNGYHATLAFWLSHCHFITPIKLDTEPEVNEKGVAVISKDTKIGFYMLKSTAKLPGTPEDKDSMVIPLFTDWQSLRKWTALGKDGAKVHTQLITFQNLYSMLKKGGAYSGIAINPFNEIPCTLPVTYLDTVVNTPGYKNEFAPKENKEGNIQEGKLEAGKKVLLGIPKDSEENQAIREKLAAYGQAQEDIYSISFLTKIEEDTKNMRHLVLLEFPQDYSKEDMKSHMEAIYNELKPVVTEIKQIEFAIKGAIPSLDELVAAHADTMVVYNN